jgi:hypothetical protein
MVELSLGKIYIEIFDIHVPWLGLGFWVWEGFSGIGGEPEVNGTMGWKIKMDRKRKKKERLVGFCVV